MKTIINNLKKEFGLDKLTFSQAVIVFWSAFAFCLMVCCDYEESAWYAIPVLVGNFALSAFCVKKFIPESFWEMDDDIEI